MSSRTTNPVAPAPVGCPRLGFGASWPARRCAHELPCNQLCRATSCWLSTPGVWGFFFFWVEACAPCRGAPRCRRALLTACQPAPLAPGERFPPNDTTHPVLASQLA